MLLPVMVPFIPQLVTGQLKSLEALALKPMIL